MTQFNLTLGYNPGVNKLDSKKNPFPLPLGYYIPAKMPMNVIFPRPDGETQSFARQKWAHTGFSYQIPIGVQGGAWPFKYEIITGLGSIGQYYGQPNYGVYTVDNTLLSSGQTYSYTIRVTDQGGASVDISRSFTVDDTKFIFIQDGYVGTKVGTITQPLEDIPDWWGASVSNATYHNKIIVFRSGQYTTTLNPAENSGNMRLQASTKTNQVIAYPNETPVWDMSTCKILDDNTASNDLYFCGITFKNARNDVNNAHYFWIVGTTNRATWWNNKFIDMSYGIVGDDNTGPIFIATTASTKNYILIKHNTCENVINGTGNGTYFTLFRTSNVLIEENIARNCTTGTGVNAKGTIAFVTIRANMFYENVTGIQLGLGYGAEAGTAPHDHEVCWNNARCPGNVIQFSNSNVFAGQTYNTFVFRNTLQGASGTCQYVGIENFETDANILNFSSYTNWNESIQTSAVANIKTTAVDTTGELTSEIGFATHGWRPY